MAYLDVITLADAKNYLRIDDTLTEDDVRIKSMIKASLSYIERRTNMLVYARDKKYIVNNYCVYVYDYPINQQITTDLDVEEKELYSIYLTNSRDVKEVYLNVGYENPTDVPAEIIECALEYLKYLYYDAETNNGTANKIPAYIDSIIYSMQRFII